MILFRTIVVKTVLSKEQPLKITLEQSANKYLIYREHRLPPSPVFTCLWFIFGRRPFEWLHLISCHRSVQHSQLEKPLLRCRQSNMTAVFLDTGSIWSAVILSKMVSPFLSSRPQCLNSCYILIERHYIIFMWHLDAHLCSNLSKNYPLFNWNSFFFC